MILKTLILLTACGGSSETQVVIIHSTVITEPDNKTVIAIEPIKETHLFICYGQSNCSGSGREVDYTVVAGAEMWVPLQGYSQELIDPTRYDGEIYSSAWPTFAKKYQELSGEKVIVLNAAFGGRLMKELQPGSRLNKRYIDWLDEALTYYKSVNENITKVSMIFVHGESDSGWGTAYNEYFKGLNAISDQLAEITPLYDNTYITRVGLNLDPFYGPERTERFINLGHEQIKRTEDRADWLPVYNQAVTYNQENAFSEVDYVHYSLSGYVKMGNEIAENINFYNMGFDMKSALIEESAILTDDIKGLLL